jgi:hypothetical protein
MDRHGSVTVIAGAEQPGPGPLTQRVIAYDTEMRRIILGGAPWDWTPLERWVDTAAFTRLGTFLERHDWASYTAMLTGWAGHVQRFDTTVRHITEAGRTVFYEIEERHSSGQHSTIVNSMTAFEFDHHSRIRALRVYLQQAR